MESGKIFSDLKHFNQEVELQKLRSRYNTPTFLELLSVGHSETAHSSVIRWLLEGSEVVSLPRETPLIHFLDILVDRDDQQGGQSIPAALKKAIISRAFSIDDLQVNCEIPVGKLEGIDPQLEGCTDRIDILVQASLNPAIEIDGHRKRKLVVVIENKIKSTEGRQKTYDNKFGQTYEQADQTFRYYYATYPRALEGEIAAEVAASMSDTIFLYVYLTPLPSALLDNFDMLDSELKPSCDRYIQVNYQDIADHIIAPILEGEGQTSRVQTFVNEYMNSLTIPGALESEEGGAAGKGELLILASSQRDKDTLEKFYRDYKSLIRKAVSIAAGPSSPACQDYVAEIVKHDVAFTAEKLNALAGPPVFYKRKPRGEFFERDGENINLTVVKDKNVVKRILDSGISDELSLVKEFAKRNLSLIMAALKILVDSNNPDEETATLYDIISHRKSQPKYFIKETGKTLRGHTALVNHIVGHYAASHPAAEIEKAFNTTQRNIVYGHTIQLPTDQSRYSHQQLKSSDGVTLWCSNQWIPSTIETFIKQVAPLGYTVSQPGDNQ